VEFVNHCIHVGLSQDLDKQMKHLPPSYTLQIINVALHFQTELGKAKLDEEVTEVLQQQ
jgi:hypothetical protein